MNSPDKLDTLAHYQQQAALAGDAAHVANLIRHASYTAQDVALLISVIGTHAAALERDGMAGFDRVSEWLDNAADVAEKAYFVPEFAHHGVKA